MTKYTMKQIREAWYAQDEQSFNEFEKNLRAPNPKFSEGQVYAYENGARYYKTGSTYGVKNPRPLNQTEVGPDWVKREPVMKLWEVADKIYSHIDNGGKLDSCTLLYDLLRDALNNFDAETSDEQ